MFPWGLLQYWTLNTKEDTQKMLKYLFLSVFPYEICFLSSHKEYVVLLVNSRGWVVFLDDQICLVME